MMTWRTFQNKRHESEFVSRDNEGKKDYNFLQRIFAHPHGRQVIACITCKEVIIDYVGVKGRPGSFLGWTWNGQKPHEDSAVAYDRYYNAHVKTAKHKKNTLLQRLAGE